MASGCQPVDKEKLAHKHFPLYPILSLEFWNTESKPEIRKDKPTNPKALWAPHLLVRRRGPSPRPILSWPSGVDRLHTRDCFSQEEATAEKQRTEGERNNGTIYSLPCFLCGHSSCGEGGSSPTPMTLTGFWSTVPIPLHLCLGGWQFPTAASPWVTHHPFLVTLKHDHSSANSPFIELSSKIPSNFLVLSITAYYTILNMDGFLCDA